MENLESRLVELEKSRIANHEMFEMLGNNIMRVHRDSLTRLSQLECYVMGMVAHIMTNTGAGDCTVFTREFNEYRDKLNKELDENKEYFDQMQSIIESKYKNLGSTSDQ